MGLEDFLISTGVDGLINLVHKRGKIETAEAAHELGMPRSTVEDWAKTLEEEGLVRIEYNLTKEFLIWSSLSPKKYTEKKKEITHNREDALKKLEKLKKSVDQNLEELAKSESEIEGKRQLVENQLGTMSVDVKEATQLSIEAKEVIEQKKRSLRELERELAKAREELAEFEEVVRNSASTKTGEGKDAKMLMEKLESSTGKLEEKVRESAARFEEITNKLNAVKEDLKSDGSAKQLQEVKKELEEVGFARNELVKSAKALLQEAGEMGKKQKSLTERVSAIEEVRGNKVDSKKLSAEIDVVYKKAMKASKDTMYEMQNNLMVVRKQIQDYSQAAYKYQTLNTHLQSIQSRYTREGAQLSELLQRLDGAQAKYDADLKAAKNSLGDNKEKFESLLNKVKQIDLMLSNISELKVEGKKLSTRLKGLMMEAQVVDMAAPEGVKSGAPVYMPAANAKRQLEGKIMTAAGAGAVSSDVSDRITLTESEEKEFEKKREELRWLIHKMWEEDRDSKTDL